MFRRIPRLDHSARTLRLLLISALVCGGCSEEDKDESLGAILPDASEHSDASSDTDDAGALEEDGAAPEEDASSEPDANLPDAAEPDAAEPDAAEPDAELHAATPEELALESAADYGKNTHGLITGATLAGWVDSWSTKRPAGVTGKLVILQVVPNLARSQTHVAGKETDVVSYLVPQSELTQFRNNGLSEIEAEIPDGEHADAFLKKYGIDALKDYVVVTFEQLPATSGAAATASSIVQQAGRAWLYLRYWGYPKERIALLNGSVNWNSENASLALTTDVPTIPPNDGSVSVRELQVDNTAIVITLDGLLDILKGKASARPLGKVTIIDARGGAEALGLRKATSTGKTDCPSYTGTGANARCSPHFEGRIKGARSVPWTQFVDSSANGFQYLSKADVKNLFDTQSEYKAGNLAIQYCRTNVRSMVTGIVASVVLGYPVQFYDTSFIEWSHLTYGPTEKTRILAENSAYRTDLTSLTEHANVDGYVPGLPYDSSTQTITGWVSGPNYNHDDDISPTKPAIVPNATTASQSVVDDRAYKL